MVDNGCGQRLQLADFLDAQYKLSVGELLRERIIHGHTIKAINTAAQFDPFFSATRKGRKGPAASPQKHVQWSPSVSSSAHV
jgi:hypothetical protein